MDLLELECLARVAQTPKRGWVCVIHLLPLARLPTVPRGTDAQGLQLALETHLGHTLPSSHSGVVFQAFLCQRGGGEMAELQLPSREILARSEPFHICFTFSYRAIRRALGSGVPMGELLEHFSLPAGIPTGFS